MTREELLALPLRELSRQTADALGLPRRHLYAERDNAVRLVRNRIEELGLTEKFTLLLGPLTNTSSYPAQIFAIMQIPANQQCIAAFLAVQEKERGE